MSLTTIRKLYRQAESHIRQKIKSYDPKTCYIVRYLDADNTNTATLSRDMEYIERCNQIQYPLILDKINSQWSTCFQGYTLVYAKIGPIDKQDPRVIYLDLTDTAALYPTHNLRTLIHATLPFCVTIVGDVLPDATVEVLQYNQLAQFKQYLRAMGRYLDHPPTTYVPVVLSPTNCSESSLYTIFYYSPTPSLCSENENEEEEEEEVYEEEDDDDYDDVIEYDTDDYEFIIKGNHTHKSNREEFTEADFETTVIDGWLNHNDPKQHITSIDTSQYDYIHTLGTPSPIREAWFADGNKLDIQLNRYYNINNTIFFKLPVVLK
ncbi:hypothetical protein CcNV_075 [Crangon crangon nudivirus]|uniref:Uncharacterized protein n=1 Tax=Crangon crangon nudivirus TaxID=2880838 RepID=A0AAE9BZW6_9VIRU|nr:hypothetical protein QKT25_gp076 [Crangon crangon nudivirus]UBZ25560.1 hypothetical protein CcNV_075 [Crangon crangon nudivirus]